VACVVAQTTHRNEQAGTGIATETKIVSSVVTLIVLLDDRLSLVPGQSAVTSVGPDKAILQLPELGVVDHTIGVQSLQPLQFVSDTHRTPRRVADVGAHLGIQLTRSGGLVVRHLVAPYDEIRKDPDVRQHNDEQHPKELCDTAEVMTPEDVCEDAHRKLEPKKEHDQP